MKLGRLSEKYESNGKPGIIANNRGDRGGKSYGLYQLAIKTGSLKEFVSKSRFKSELVLYRLGSAEFDHKWKELARDHRQEFIDDQHDYIKRVYFDPVRLRADRLGIPDTEAVNQVLWSTAVQHGVGWTRRKLTGLGGRTEEQVIKKIYYYRSYQFKHSNYYSKTASRKRIRDNVLKRFRNELAEALKLIK